MYNKAERFFVNKTNGVKTDCKHKMPSCSVRTNESSKSHFCHLLPLGKLFSNSHSPEYCYTACTSHEPILMYDVCNDWICVRGWRRNEIAETPIENAELELFVDGSAQVIEGNRRAGYAVTSTTEVVASGRLPDHFSAQAAELVALTRACTLASGSVLQQLQCCVREGKPGLMCHTVKLFPHLQG